MYDKFNIAGNFTTVNYAHKWITKL